MSATEPINLVTLQNDLLQKTEALNKAIAEGRSVEELKGLFTECSRIYEAILQLKNGGSKDKQEVI